MTSKRLSKSKTYRISIYTRVSTEEQAENPEGSIKTQELRLREYVKLKNLVEPFGDVVAIYSDPGISAKDLRFDAYAYICGLNFMVSGVRELLTEFGWHRKQIVFERYD